MTERRAVHAYLSADAHEGWLAFSEDNGVSITGLLESLGTELLAEIEAAGDSDIRRDWVKRARRVDAIRRRRNRD